MIHNEHNTCGYLADSWTIPFWGRNNKSLNDDWIPDICNMPMGQKNQTIPSIYVQRTHKSCNSSTTIDLSTIMSWHGFYFCCNSVNVLSSHDTWFPTPKQSVAVEKLVYPSTTEQISEMSRNKHAPSRRPWNKSCRSTYGYNDNTLVMTLHTCLITHCSCETFMSRSKNQFTGSNIRRLMNEWWSFHWWKMQLVYMSEHV